MKPITRHCGSKMTKALPAEELRRAYAYDADSGKFTRIDGRYWKNGYIDRKGYLVITCGGTRYFAHRVAWLFYTGVDPGSFEIDHINRDRSDNRIANLRLATDVENKWNRPKRSSNTTGFKGVIHRPKQKDWVAVIHANGKAHHLGLFQSPEEASQAYRTAAIRLHGEFARFE